MKWPLPKELLYFQVKEHGACSVRIHNWQTWNGGMNGRLKVHLKEEHDMPNWSAFLVLDREVTDFTSYDGEVNTNEGKTFKIRDVLSLCQETKSNFLQQKIVKGKNMVISD